MLVTRAIANDAGAHEPYSTRFDICSTRAGLGLAAALKKVGIPYLVLEQRGELSQEGAAIALWGNAMKALEQIGAPLQNSCRTAPPVLENRPVS